MKEIVHRNPEKLQIQKLRAEREKILKAQGSNLTTRCVNKTDFNEGNSVVTWRRRLVGVVDKESFDIKEREREVKRTATKLRANFDRVANDRIWDPMKGGVAEAVVARTRSQRAVVEKVMVFEKETKVKSKGKRLMKKSFQEAEEAVAAKGTRTSPRLASEFNFTGSL